MLFTQIAHMQNKTDLLIPRNIMTSYNVTWMLMNKAVLNTNVLRLSMKQRQQQQQLLLLLNH